MYALYKDMLFVTNWYPREEKLYLRARSEDDLQLGFYHLIDQFSQRDVIEKLVQINELESWFGVEMFAIYQGIEFRFTFSCDGSYTTWSKECLDRRRVEDSPQAMYLLGIGFEHVNDDILKTITPSECEEIFEIRKDKFFPKNFIPGVTQELNGGFIVTDYNYDKYPFITSRKTVYRDGIKVAEFTKDLW